MRHPHGLLDNVRWPLPGPADLAIKCSLLYLSASGLLWLIVAAGKDPNSLWGLVLGAIDGYTVLWLYSRLSDWLAATLPPRRP